MSFAELTLDEQLEFDGGIVASAGWAIAGGVCYIGAGIASLAGYNKLAGGLTILGGGCDIAAGICLILP